MKVLLTDYAWPDLDIEKEVLSGAGHELIVAPDGDEDTLIRFAEGAAAIMTCWAQVTAKVIDAADCQLVSRLGIGLDNIDVEHCTSRRIPVTNVPTYCVDEVAEHALALLMSLARNVAFFHLRTKRDEYCLTAAPPMRRITGQTIGIAGFGKIGQSLAQRALGMGLNVVVFDKFPYNGTLNVEQVPFEVLLERSDLISIHLPLTEETRHLFSTDAFARMKSTAFVANTARGAIIDRAALHAALESGQLAGAGLDVQEVEPPDLTEPLYQSERVIVTPHSAFTSLESLADLRRTTALQVCDCLAGRQPASVVNPQVYNAS